MTFPMLISEGAIEWLSESFQALNLWPHSYEPHHYHCSIPHFTQATLHDGQLYMLKKATDLAIATQRVALKFLYSRLLFAALLLRSSTMLSQSVLICLA